MSSSRPQADSLNLGCERDCVSFIANTLSYRSREIEKGHGPWEPETALESSDADRERVIIEERVTVLARPSFPG